MTLAKFLDEPVLAQLLDVILLSCCDIGLLATSKILNMTSQHTLVDYAQFCRDICSWYLVEHPGACTIGGPGHIVQIDESVMAKRKYNRGRVVKERWVLGLYNPLYERGVIVHVPNRRAETLMEEIQKFARNRNLDR